MSKEGEKDPDGTNAIIEAQLRAITRAEEVIGVLENEMSQVREKFKNLSMRTTLMRRELSGMIQATRLVEERPELLEKYGSLDDLSMVMSRPVSDLNLSVQGRKGLIRLNINMIGELIRHTAEDLLEAKNCGKGTVDHIRKRLAEMDLTLSGE